MNARLFRSRNERIISGVCGGIAELLNVDPSIVRILFAILVPLTGGFVILLYLVMSFVVPEQPPSDDRWANWERQASEGPPPIRETEAMPFADAAPSVRADEAPTAAFAPPTAVTSDLRPPSAGTMNTAGATGRWQTATPEPDTRREWEPFRNEQRSGANALIVGLILVLVGAFFLARSYLPAIDWDRSWPLLLVGIGVLLLVGALRRSSSKPG